MIQLSIITTLYKSEPYIRKCLDSLLNQDILEDCYELVIVDDGSPDNCALIVEEYQKTHKNIVLVRQENMGLPGARNTGVKNAKGEYVTFVDPDDFVNVNVYGTLLKKVYDEQLDMLRFNYTLTEECSYKALPKFKESLISVSYLDDIVSGEQFLGDRLGYACYVWQFITKRSLFIDNNITFREKVFDDADVMPRLLLNAHRVTSVDTLVYNYLIRTGSLVNVVNKQAAEKKLNGLLFIAEKYNEYYQLTDNVDAKLWLRTMVSALFLVYVRTVAQFCYCERTERLKSFYSVNNLRFYRGKRTWKKSIHMCLSQYCTRLYMLLYKVIYC